MLPTYTLDQIAFYLTDTGQAFFGEDRQKWAVPPGGTITYNTGALNPGGKAFVDAAFGAWSSVSGLQFRQVPFGADIDFSHGQLGDGAFAVTSINSRDEITGSTITISEDWIRDDWDTDFFGNVTVDYASYSFQTYVHEIGHALGLAHGGPYNSFASYPNNAVYSNDSWQATIMSYFDQLDNTTIDASFAYVVTPQAADILAIQDLYGGTFSAQAGNTTYGFGANTGTYLDQIFASNTAITYTIFDTGGLDTIDYRTTAINQFFNLVSEGISNLGGLTGNVIIAPGTVIENAIGGSGDDRFVGNSADNHLEGRGGDDTYTPAGGDDTVIDGLGNNTANGGEGADKIIVFSGLNTLLGDEGNDLIVGGFQSDSLSGGADNDLLRGDASDGPLGGSDRLNGGTGDDLLMGGLGADTFVFRPNEGFDTIGAFDLADVTYSSATGYTASASGPDFVSGLDTIELVGFTGISAANVLAFVSDSGSGAVFSAQSTSITFADVPLADLSADDFIFA